MLNISTESLLKLLRRPTILGLRSNVIQLYGKTVADWIETVL
jgi:hypothetical protein